MKQITSFILFFICFFGTTFATCYISPQGNNTGDCTDSSQPCETISYCVTQTTETSLIVSLSSGTYGSSNCGFVFPPISNIVSLNIQAPAEYPNTVTIDCTGANQNHLTFSQVPNLSVEINDINFIGGSSTGSGGCIYADNIKSLVVKNSLFSKCNSGSLGGAIYVNSSSTNLLDSVFSDNIATDAGGAIYLVVNGTSIDKCDIYSNSANFGGGLYLVGDYLSLSSSNVSQNNAQTNGGGLYIKSNTPTFLGAYNFMGTQITNNSALLGGGLYAGNLDHKWNVFGALFKSNFATQSLGDTNIACGILTSPFCDSCSATDCTSECAASVEQSCSQTNSTMILCYGTKFTTCSSTDTCTCAPKGLSKTAKIIIVLICICLFVGIVLIIVDLVKFFLKKRSRATYAPI